MKYLNILCPYANYYGKFDVDTFVDIKKLTSITDLSKSKTHFFYGAEKQKWKKVSDVQSFKYSSTPKVAKYYNSLFPKNGIDVYSGFATFLSSDLPMLLFNYSLKYTNLMRIDDQYISWLLYKLNIKINRISSYAILPNKCDIYKNVTVIHRLTSTDMLSYSIYYKDMYL